MNRRDFLQVSVLGLGALIAAGLSPENALWAANSGSGTFQTWLAKHHWPYTLPDLHFGYRDLEPLLDAKTLEIHHKTIQGGAVEQLNKEITALKWTDKDLQDLTLPKLINRLIASTDITPPATRARILNLAGTHLNHTLYFRNLNRPPITGENTPTPKIRQAIEAAYGKFDKFQLLFADTGAKLFGSGWVFLTWNTKTQKVEILTAPVNQTRHQYRLLLACDVWEHAYYLQYKNKRTDYLKNFWQLINWAEVEKDLPD
jgi:Fe-Mn family superoxide dismutase